MHPQLGKCIVTAIAVALAFASPLLSTPAYAAPVAPAESRTVLPGGTH